MIIPMSNTENKPNHDKKTMAKTKQGKRQQNIHTRRTHMHTAHSYNTCTRNRHSSHCTGDARFVQFLARAAGSRCQTLCCSCAMSAHGTVRTFECWPWNAWRCDRAGNIWGNNEQIDVNCLEKMLPATGTIEKKLSKRSTSCHACRSFWIVCWTFWSTLRLDRKSKSARWNSLAYYHTL